MRSAMPRLSGRASTSCAIQAATASRVLLKWSTAAVGYDLVATNALMDPPNAFTPIGPAPVVVNGKFTVTNTTAGANNFYELRKP